MGKRCFVCGFFFFIFKVYENEVGTLPWFLQACTSLHMVLEEIQGSQHICFFHTKRFSRNDFPALACCAMPLQHLKHTLLTLLTTAVFCPLHTWKVICQPEMKVLFWP